MGTMGPFEDYLKKEEAKEEYVSKNTFDKKISEIEATLSKKITKEEIPKMPNLTDFIKKSQFDSLVIQKKQYILNQLYGLLNKSYFTLNQFNCFKKEFNKKMKKYTVLWKDI